jgi:hypothetical protein
MSRFWRYHGFVWLGLLSYLLMAVPSWLRFDYDSGGWQGGLVFLGYAAGTPYRWVYRFLFNLGGHRGFSGIQFGVAVLGFLLFVLADLAGRSWARRRKGASVKAA